MSVATSVAALVATQEDRDCQRAALRRVVEANAVVEKKKSPRTF